MTSSEEIEQLLRQAHDNERDAWDRLLRHTYDDLKRLARQQLRRSRTMPTLDTTGLVNEWYIRQHLGRSQSPADRQHYFALAAKIMRQIICACARERLALKRGNGRPAADIDAVENELLTDAGQFLAIEQALDRLGTVDQTLVRVVECRFFAGMSEAETAEALGMSLRTVQREWARAREQLSATLEP